VEDPGFPDKKNYGREGEERAALRLQSEGFNILARNYFAGRNGEIDIVAVKNSLLLFVEVKTRSTGDTYGGAIYSISRRKINSLKKSAQHFLLNNPQYYKKEITCRFDLISFEGDDFNWVEDIVR